MLWYRLVGQVFVPESQHHSHAGDVLAAVLESPQVSALASHLGSLQHSTNRSAIQRMMRHLLLTLLS